MSIQLKTVNVGIILSLLFILILGAVPVNGAILTTYVKEAEFLTQLQVLSTGMDLNKEVTSLQFVTYLEDLVNGRGSDVLVNLTSQVTLPETPISYQEALTIAGIFMGYSRDSSYSKVRDLTPDLTKKDQDHLTGYEMTYICYQLLHTRREGQQVLLLEERYIVGSNPKIVDKAIDIKDSQLILDENGGIFHLAKDVQAFVLSGEEIQPVSLSRIVLGMAEVKLFFDQTGQVKTVVSTAGYSPSRIRVLLSQELDQLGGSKSYDFSEIQIKATQPFKIVVFKDGVEETELVAEKNEVITFTNQDGQVRFITQNGKVTRLIAGRVYLKSYYSHTICFDPLLSSPRRGNVPVYAGVLEIFPSEKTGYLNLVNELPLEMYLRKVVPGQIPSSWPKETFKVQAIAARSYAITQINRGKFKDYSAHVDDSTASQIYNNIVEVPEINEAIAETEGVVALHSGQVIDAVYFSTSPGFTANNEEVWHSYLDNHFPGISVPYLRSISLVPYNPTLNLDTEAKALAFFKNQSTGGYDSSSPYYRWMIELTREELENTINQNLPLRKKADTIQGTDFVRCLQGYNLNPDDTGFTIGQLQDLRVVQRGAGGNIMILDIVGSYGTYRVMKEYNIRYVLRPNQEETGSTDEVIIQTHDGGEVINYPILPSAFAAFEIIRNLQNEIEKVKIYGGGMGHGVGLSQWGMKGLALEGSTYEEILKHFYQGITLEKIY